MSKKIVINGVINISKSTITTTPHPKKIIINMFEIYSGLLQEEYSYYILQDDIDYAKILLDE